MTNYNCNTNPNPTVKNVKKIKEHERDLNSGPLPSESSALTVTPGRHFVLNVQNSLINPIGRNPISFSGAVWKEM